MKALKELASALQDVLDPTRRAEEGVYLEIARRVRSKLQDGQFDILPANYCESCPVRQRVERDMGVRRPWFINPHGALEKW